MTNYAWRKRFGEFDPVDEKRLRRLEQVNGNRKTLLAERDHEIEVINEVAEKRW